MQKIRKGDFVVVISGRDAGKKGEVLRSLPSSSRIVVRGVGLVKRHLAPSRSSQGGIIEKESPIHVSNVAHVDPKDGKPVRVGFRALEDGSKVRVSKRTGEIISGQGAAS